MKKTLFVLFSLVFVFTTLPMTRLSVLADEYSGSCGKNATWTLSKDTGLLIVSGTGDMYDFDFVDEDEDNIISYTPWTKSQVKSVKINNGVTSIGEGAFAACSSLIKVVIADSVTKIGAWAFAKCDNLTNITIPDRVEEIGGVAFWNCRKLTKIKLPNSLSFIGNAVFTNCKKLTSLKIGSGLKGDLISNTFGGSGIKNIIVSSKNKNYSSKDGVLYNKNKTKLVVYPPKKELSSFTIPDSVETIYDFAFYVANNLEHLIISKNVQKIGFGAFVNDKIKTLKVSSKSKYFRNIDNVIFNKSNTKLYFYLETKSSKKYTVPSSVKTIGKGAFYECENLEKVTLSNNLIKVEQYAFGYCPQLKSIVIPNSVQSIGNSAFLCDNLNKVIIPDHVTFGPDSFVGSDDLKIYSNKNSFAAKHAKDWGFKFRCVISKPVKDVKVAKRTSTSIKLKWKKIDGVKGYKIYDANQKKTIKTVTTNTSSATISGLKSGSTHRYKIRAYKVIAGAKYYGDYSKTITAKTK